MTKSKTFLLAAIILLLGACAQGQLSSYIAENNTIDKSTTSGKLKACSLEEAAKKIEDGSAFAQSISASSDEISTICIKKLALEAAGLDSKATEDATNALQTLLNTASSYMK